MTIFLPNHTPYKLNHVTRSVSGCYFVVLPCFGPKQRRQSTVRRDKHWLLTDLSPWAVTGWSASRRGARPLLWDKMDHGVAFQSKLTSIMEKLAQAAVLEISRVWEDGFALFQVELRRRQSEIEALNKKLKQMEHERLSAPIQTANLQLSSSTSRREQNNSKLLPPSGDGERFDPF